MFDFQSRLHCYVDNACAATYASESSTLNKPQAMQSDRGNLTGWLLIFAFSLALTACGGSSESVGTAESNDEQPGQDTNLPGEEQISDPAQSDDDTGDDDQADEQEVDSSFTVSPDGTIIRMVADTDITAQEGSTVILSFSIENIDNDSVSLRSISWRRVDDLEFNTTVTEDQIDQQTLSVLLPLVEADTTLHFEAFVIFYLRDEAQQTSEEIRLSLPFQVDVVDGLPSDGQVIIANGRPAPGIPDATIGSIDLYDYSLDGKVVMAGSYRIGNTLQGNAIWAGTRDNLQLMLKTGDAITGLPGNATFDKVDSLNIASGGEFAALAQLQGAGTSRAALVSEAGIVQSILRSGDPFPTTNVAGQLTVISSIKRTTNGALFYAGTNTRDEGGFWNWTADGFELVALTYRAMASVIPTQETDSSALATLGFPISADGCLISVTEDVEINDNGDAAFIGNVGAVLTIDPITVQQVLIPTDCTRGFNATRRLVQYQQGIASEVVGSGDYELPGFGLLMAIPGIAAGGFQIEDIRDVYEDGSVLFNAEILEDFDSVFGLPLRAKAVLKTTPNGSGPVSLVALETETLPPNFIQRFDEPNRFYTAPTHGEQVTVMTNASDGMILLAGTGHEGQPHSSLSAVGASALRYAAGEGASAPQDFPSTAFFSTFSLPVVDSSGVVRFQAILRDSTDNAILQNGLWTSYPDGTVSLRASTFAPVQSDDVQVWLKNTDVPLQNITPASGNTQLISQRLATDSEGGLVFIGDLDDTRYGTNNNAMVYIPAD